ncbi:hypothetical protein DVH24_001904 [Malus domestica]|uniref:Endonuclease/exonuclease/phosphatase domain-containing protein n=1 Tax=Malus domestica TaxID=3750 RepID=A0A498I4F1_MALDO|nr:hypothetical protein DVH24_001904 [Malus domestica]
MARIPASYWDSIGMVLLGFNVRGQSFPNIWVFHSINILSPSVCSSSSQYLFVQFVVGNMIGRPRKTWEETLRKDLEYLDLTEDMTQNRAQWRFSSPLLVVGDFNAVLGAHEKSGGNLPRQASSTDFQNMVYVWNLVQIDLKESSFT